MADGYEIKDDIIIINRNLTVLDFVSNNKFEEYESVIRGGLL